MMMARAATITRTRKVHCFKKAESVQRPTVIKTRPIYHQAFLDFAIYSSPSQETFLVVTIS